MEMPLASFGTVSSFGCCIVIREAAENYSVSEECCFKSSNHSIQKQRQLAILKNNTKPQ
jgi:hypothetical protein